MAIISVSSVQADKVRATFEAPVNINLFDLMLCKLGLEVSATSRITHVQVMETPAPSDPQEYDAPVAIDFTCPEGNCHLTVAGQHPDILFTDIPSGGFGEGKLVMEVTFGDC